MLTTILRRADAFMRRELAKHGYDGAGVVSVAVMPGHGLTALTSLNTRGVQIAAEYLFEAVQKAGEAQFVAWPRLHSEDSP